MQSIDWPNLIEYITFEVISNLISGIALLLIAYITYSLGKKQSEKEFKANLELMREQHNEEMAFQRKRTDDELHLAQEQLKFEKQKWTQEMVEKNKLDRPHWEID
jgi:hypothetical protein